MRITFIERMGCCLYEIDGRPMTSDESRRYKKEMEAAKDAFYANPKNHNLEGKRRKSPSQRRRDAARSEARREKFLNDKAE